MNLKLIPTHHTSSEAESLARDDLWERAQAFCTTKDGWVRVSCFNGNTVNVELTFRRASGSKIEAVGSHTDVRHAFISAIEEAYSLGAKP